MNTLAGRRLRLAAAALAALLGRALLVVHQHGHALDRRQLPLHVEQIVPVPDVGPAAELAAQPGRVVGGDDDLADALGRQQGQQPVDRQLAHRLLAAGHRHRRVAQQLEGDVHPGRDRRPDRQAAGVGEGAVADVLHEVLLRDERRQADPLRALAAHLRQPGDGADLRLGHQQDHRVAADPAADQRSRRDLGRGVVRAARAEVRRARRQRQHDPLPSRRRARSWRFRSAPRWRARPAATASASSSP